MSSRWGMKIEAELKLYIYLTWTVVIITVSIEVGVTDKQYYHLVNKSYQMNDLRFSHDSALV